MTKKCEVCGKEFKTSHSNKSCCSDRCREKKHREKLKKRTVICETCGKEFTPTGSYQKYCSKKCRPSYQKVCEVCGKKFVASKITAKTCSRSCSSKRAHGFRNKSALKKKKSTRLEIARDKLKNGEKLTAFDIAALALEEGVSYGQYVCSHCI